MNIARSRERAAFFLVAGGVLYAALGLAAFPEWTVDDAFITYRYAENLALGGQLTWNLGEDPVEGYTGVGLPVLLAAAVRMGLGAEPASKAIGVASFLGGSLILYLLLRRLKVRGALRAGLATIYLTAPLLLTHSLSGLETMLFSLSILGTLYGLQALLDAPESPALREIGVLVLSLLTGLVRPEGVVLAGLVVACVIAARLAGRRRLAPFLWRTLIVLILPGAVYFMWRYSYYGHLLPNTYYAKWSRRVSYDSVRDLGKFLVLYASVPLLSAAVVAVLGWRNRHSRSSDLDLPAQRPKESAARVAQYLAVPLVGIIFFLVVALQYSRSALIMNYSHRFFAPYYSILLMWAGILLECGLRRADGRAAGALRAFLARAAVASLLFAQLCIQVRMLPGQIRYAQSTKDLLVDEHIAVGRFLRQHVPNDEWLVVVVDAGAIPYYSGLKTVDFGGLNDEFLARRFRDRIPKALIIDYFFARNPGAIVFTSKFSDRIEGPESLPFENDSRFENYVHVTTYSSPSWPNYYELVFLRRDLADRPDLLGRNPLL